MSREAQLTTASGTRAAARRRTPVLVFCSALLLYALTAGGSLTSTDAVVTFELTRSLVERHAIALPSNVLGLEANRGIDGRYYSQYGIGQSLYNIPFYLAGRAVQGTLHRQIGKPDTLLKAAVALGSALAAALAVALIYQLSILLGRSPRGALVASLAAAAASPLWPYSKFGFSTALTAALLLGTAVLLTAAARSTRVAPAAGAGLVLAFGWLTRHELALVLVPFAACLWLASERREIAVRQIAVFAAVTACGGLLWAWYNLVRFGSPLSVGYAPRFGVAGYLAFLAAPAGSIVLFAPIALLWLYGLWRWRTERATAVLLGGPLVLSYLFYGALVDWPGGRSYGPRYLVPALVLLAPAAAWLWDARRPSRSVIVAVIGGCALLQLPGVVVDYSKVSVEWARGASPTAIAERNWHLASSPLVLDAAAARRLVPENLSYLSGVRPPPALDATGASEDRDFSQRFAFSLDFWWMYLFYLHALSRGAALLIATFLTLGAAAAGVAAWHSAPPVRQA